MTNQVPENRNLRGVKERLAEEAARVEARRAVRRRFAASTYLAGEAAGVIVLGLAAGIVAIFAFGATAPWLWLVAALLGLACAVDAWVIIRRGNRT